MHILHRTLKTRMYLGIGWELYSTHSTLTTHFLEHSSIDMLLAQQY